MEIHYVDTYQNEYNPHTKKYYARFSVKCPYCNKKYPYKVYDEKITYNDGNLYLRRKHRCSQYNKVFYAEYELTYNNSYEILVDSKENYNLIKKERIKK